MKYTVVWTAAARDKLAELWLQASDRNAIADAVERIDRLLARNPGRQGESRAGSERVMFVGPLVVIFEVDEPNRLVTVTSIRPLRK